MMQMEETNDDNKNGHVSSADPTSSSSLWSTTSSSSCSSLPLALLHPDSPHNNAACSNDTICSDHQCCTKQQQQQQHPYAYSESNDSTRQGRLVVKKHDNDHDDKDIIERTTASSSSSSFPKEQTVSTPHPCFLLRKPNRIVLDLTHASNLSVLLGWNNKNNQTRIDSTGCVTNDTEVDHNEDDYDDMNVGDDWDRSKLQWFLTSTCVVDDDDDYESDEIQNQGGIDDIGNNQNGTIKNVTTLTHCVDDDDDDDYCNVDVYTTTTSKSHDSISHASTTQELTWWDRPPWAWTRHE
jgi:hypothetical protein